MPGLTEFVPFDGPEPDPIPSCPTGIHQHRWIMAIEEGNPVFMLAEGEECVMHAFYPHEDPRPVCPEALSNFIANEPEMVECGGFPVRISFIVEQYFEDSAVWLDITPETER